MGSVEADDEWQIADADDLNITSLQRVCCDTLYTYDFDNCNVDVKVFFVYFVDVQTSLMS